MRSCSSDSAVTSAVTPGWPSRSPPDPLCQANLGTVTGTSPSPAARQARTKRSSIWGKTRRKNLAEIMQDIAPLIIQRRFFEQDFPCSPQPFED
jgi:hypothetical protein